MQVTHPHALAGLALPGAVKCQSETYSIGSDGVIDCPDDEAAAVADVLATAHDVEPDAIIVQEEDKPPDGAPIADPPLNPADFSVAELRDALQDTDYSDAKLEAIADAERSTKDRTTAHDAIDAARSD